MLPWHLPGVALHCGAPGGGVGLNEVLYWIEYACTVGLHTSEGKKASVGCDEMLATNGTHCMHKET